MITSIHLCCIPVIVFPLYDDVFEIVSFIFYYFIIRRIPKLSVLWYCCFHVNAVTFFSPGCKLSTQAVPRLSWTWRNPRTTVSCEHGNRLMKQRLGVCACVVVKWYSIRLLATLRSPVQHSPGACPRKEHSKKLYQVVGVLLLEMFAPDGMLPVIGVVSEMAPISLTSWQT